MQQQDYKEVKMYCPNCGQLLMGYKRADGTVFMTCGKCHVVLCSKLVSKKKASIRVEYPY